MLEESKSLPDDGSEGAEAFETIYFDSNHQQIYGKEDGDIFSDIQVTRFLCNEAETIVPDEIIPVRVKEDRTETSVKDQELADTWRLCTSHKEWQCAELRCIKKFDAKWKMEEHFKKEHLENDLKLNQKKRKAWEIQNSCEDKEQLSTTTTAGTSSLVNISTLVGAPFRSSKNSSVTNSLVTAQTTSSYCTTPSVVSTTKPTCKLIEVPINSQGTNSVGTQKFLILIPQHLQSGGVRPQNQPIVLPAIPHLPSPQLQSRPQLPCPQLQSHAQLLPPPQLQAHTVRPSLQVPPQLTSPQLQVHTQPSPQLQVRTQPSPQFQVPPLLPSPQLQSLSWLPSPLPQPLSPQLPPESYHSSQQPTSTIDSSKVFSVSLAQFPAYKRFAIKQKLMELVNAVANRNLDPDRMIIAYL